MNNLLSLQLMVYDQREVIHCINSLIQLQQARNVVCIWRWCSWSWGLRTGEEGEGGWVGVGRPHEFVKL
ncbi:hypothetical protein Hanom_Chr06g00503751 [Helianthus anomalus]